MAVSESVSHKVVSVFWHVFPSMVAAINALRLSATDGVHRGSTFVGAMFDNYYFSGYLFVMHYNRENILKTTYS